MKTRINSAVMKRLDALTKHNACASIMAWIEPVYDDPNAAPSRWEATINLWDGVPRSGGKVITSLHATMDEAVNAANAVIEKHPCKSAHVFIDDIFE